MKKVKRQMKLLIVIILILPVQLSYAQFNQLGGIAPEGHTNPTLSKVGIGTFPNAAAILSALHVDGNLTATQTGETFLTNSPDISTYWRMQRDNTEVGKIYSFDAATDGDGFHFYMASSFADDVNALFGEIRFNTPNFAGFNTNRMRIMGGNGPGSVGIGDYSAFIPQNLLHQHTGTIANYHQFTNDATDIDADDGLLVGNADQIGIINNQEDAPINFFTNSLPRMQIFDGSGTAMDGHVGIGDFTKFTPQSLLHVNGTITAKQVVIKTENTSTDLLAVIESLQTEITQLKKQMNDMHIAFNETKN